MLLLARTKPLSEVSKKTDGLSVFLLDMQKAKNNGLTIKLSCLFRASLNTSTQDDIMV